MFKTFSFGIVLGIVLAAVAAWYLPVADLHRESSLITVQPNGGNAELFRIHIPDDRIAGGGNASGVQTPAGLDWPDIAPLDGVELELFKLRNRNDVVIGVASRITAGTPDVVEWTLHFPARGTLYALLAAAAGPDGERSGQVRTGTREFGNRGGRLSERYIVAGAEDAGEGYIELLAQLIAIADDSGAYE